MRDLWVLCQYLAASLSVGALVVGLLWVWDRYFTVRR
jgi:hypothetical protein